MKIKTAVSAALALSLLSSGFAFAAGPNRGNSHNRGPGNAHNAYNSHDNRGGHQRDDHRNERGAGPNHSFHRGDRLPTEYRSHQYVVDDWRGHHLSAPPRGYHWVQTGGDYVLVAISTGIIMNFLLGN